MRSIPIRKEETGFMKTVLEEDTLIACAISYSSIRCDVTKTCTLTKTWFTSRRVRVQVPK